MRSAKVIGIGVVLALGGFCGGRAAPALPSSAAPALRVTPPSTMI